MPCRWIFLHNLLWKFWYDNIFSMNMILLWHLDGRSCDFWLDCKAISGLWNCSVGPFHLSFCQSGLAVTLRFLEGKILMITLSCFIYVIGLDGYLPVQPYLWLWPPTQISMSNVKCNFNSLATILFMINLHVPDFTCSKVLMIIDHSCLLALNFNSSCLKVNARLRSLLGFYW